jgi:hypothetical protein
VICALKASFSHFNEQIALKVAWTVELENFQGYSVLVLVSIALADSTLPMHHLLLAFLVPLEGLQIFGVKATAFNVHWDIFAIQKLVLIVFNVLQEPINLRQELLLASRVQKEHIPLHGEIVFANFVTRESSARMLELLFV